MMMDDVVFIDVQGFKTTDNAFILKEFCLLHGNFEFHDIVKSPCMRKDLSNIYKRQADWLTFTYHGLKFDSGNITLNELIELTSEHVNGRTLVVKGYEKAEWMRKIYGNYDVECVNADEFRSFIFTTTTKYEIDSICPHHKRLHGFNKCNCALSRARQLKDSFPFQ